MRLNRSLSAHLKVNHIISIYFRILYGCAIQVQRFFSQYDFWRLFATFSLLVNCSCPYLPGRRIIRSGFLFFQIAISLEAAQTSAASTQGPPSTYISQTKKRKDSSTWIFKFFLWAFARGGGEREENVSIFIPVPTFLLEFFRGRGRHTFSHHRSDIHTWASRKNFPRILLEISPRSICAQVLFWHSLLRERKLLSKLQN